MCLPRHVGIRGNEIADDLAKKGAGNTPVGPEPLKSMLRSGSREK